MRELGVGRALRHREAHGGDDLVRRQRRREEAGEVVVGLDLAAVGDDRRAQGEHGRRVVGGRIGMGERAADRAAVADLRVADPAGEVGQARDPLAHLGRRADLVMGDERADHQLAPLGTDLLEAVDPGEPGERHQVRGLREVQLHHRQQALPAGQQLGRVVPLEQRDRVGDRPRTVKLEVPHATPPAVWIARQTFSGVAGMSISVTPSGARASSTALITAGGTPIAPDLAHPLDAGRIVRAGGDVVAHLEGGEVRRARHAVAHEGAREELPVVGVDALLEAAPGRSPAPGRRAPGRRRSSG